MARIPTSQCLTCGGCAHQKLVGDLEISLGKGQWLALLGFALLLERGIDAGKSSSWNAYLRYLPAAEQGVTALWPENRKRYLAGTDVDLALRDERAQAKTEWETHIEPILSRSEYAESGFTFEDYLSARSVVSSRAFTICPEVGVGLVPLADLFNHRTGGHHVLLTDIEDESILPESARPQQSTKEGASYMYVRLVRSARKDEELFNSYGELGNATLLSSYGFCQRDNPGDQVTFGVPALRAAAGLCGVDGLQIASRLRWCEANGLCEEDSTFHLKAQSPPSNTLLLVLWILAASPDEFGEFSDSLKGKRMFGTDKVAQYISEVQHCGGFENVKTLQVLMKMLERRRALYASTPSDDSEWASYCLILVDSELGIILDCEKYLEEKLNGRFEAGNASKKRKVISTGNIVCTTTTSDAAFSLFD